MDQTEDRAPGQAAEKPGAAAERLQRELPTIELDHVVGGVRDSHDRYANVDAPVTKTRTP